MAKRAERRAHKARMKARARRVYSRYKPEPWWDNSVHERLADHMAVCSGPCCGNPRRWWNELTMQERRFLLDEVGNDDD